MQKNNLPMPLRLFITAITVLLLFSCNSRQDSRTSLSVLGIHSLYVEPGDISKISIVREVGGERKEWIARPLAEEGLSIHIQLGLPTNVMRVAIGDSKSSVTSAYKPDVISEHAYTFISVPIDKTGEHVLMETKSEKLPKQNRIILIAE